MSSQDKIDFAYFEYKPDLHINDHALIGVSPFNGYFSAENIESLLRWGINNFKNFNIFTMDQASKYNLLATGYEENRAIRKANKHDRNQRNRIVTCLKNIGFSEHEAEQKIISLTDVYETDIYKSLYQKYLTFFQENHNFQVDCINASKSILESKVAQITDENINIALKYLFLELPIWFNTPDLLGIQSSVLVYKDLTTPWRNLCCNYGLMSPQQKFCIKDITQ